MALKKLSLFQRFDIEAFLEKKKLQTIGVKEWRDYETQNLLGTKVEIVIISDETDYGNSEGEVISNLYEKLNVKIPAKLTNVPIGTTVSLAKPTAIIFGEFRNQLSINAENLKIIGK